jgi:phage tail tape-measure protein
MKKKKVQNRLSKRRLAHEAEGAAAGAIAGAALGAAAGPPGLVAGAVIGAAVGAATGAALDTRSAELSKRERELDKETGVTSGEMGAPNLKHPAPEVGAYSSASAGTEGSSGAPPAEGPLSGPQ